MLYSFLLLFAIVPLACLAGAAYAWKVAKTSIRYGVYLPKRTVAILHTTFNLQHMYARRELASTEAKWQQQLQKENPGGNVLESFTLGWLNLVLQAMWTPVLEKHVAALTTELLHRVFNEVLKNNSQKVPWRYIESIALEELSFGQVPPTFQTALAKYDPTTSLLNVAMDARFNSSSAQAVMIVKTRALPLLAPLTVRLEATHVQFKGRLNLGLLLGNEPPGISGIFYSFASPPRLDIAVRPLGMPLPAEFDMGLAGALQGVLRRIISRRMVEPQRRYFDLNRLYMNRHIARFGGPGGVIRIVVHSTRNLLPSSMEQTQPHDGAAAPVSNSTGSSRTASAPAGKVQRYASYCQVRLSGQQQVLRTPIRHHTATEDAGWDWQLMLALPADITAAADAAGAGVVAELGVYDAQTVGQPVMLGRCRVSLNSLHLTPNGAPRTVWLPLKAAANKQAALQVTVTWLKSTRPQRQQSATHEHTSSTTPDSTGVAASTPPASSMSPLSAPASMCSNGRAHSSSTDSLGPVAHVPAGKAVTWHDEEFRRAAQQQPAGCIASPTVNSNRVSVEVPGCRLSKSVGGSPLASAKPPTVIGSASSAHRRSASFDLASLSPAVHLNESASTVAADSRTCGSNSRLTTPATTATSAALQAADYAVGSSPTQGHQQQRQQGPSHTGHWLWPGSSALGSWLGFSSTPQPAADAAAVTAAVMSTVPGDAAAHVAEVADKADRTHAAAATPEAADSTRANSPLAMLAGAVQMQRHVQQQQQQVAALQQQLAHVTSSYQQMQETLWTNARAALLQGGRFLLPFDDGTVQQVLLYLDPRLQQSTADGAAAAAYNESSASSHVSSRSNSISAVTQQPHRQQQYLQEGGNGCLVVAALPVSRRAEWQPSPGEGRLKLAISRAKGRLHLRRRKSVSSDAAGKPVVTASVCAARTGGPLSRRLAFWQCKQLARIAYESSACMKGGLPVLQVLPASSLIEVKAGTGHGAYTSVGTVSSSSFSSDNRSLAAQPYASAGAAENVEHQQQHLFLHFNSESGVSVLHLQVPPAGNGRSRDEWLFALEQLLTQTRQQLSDTCLLDS